MLRSRLVLGGVIALFALAAACGGKGGGGAVVLQPPAALGLVIAPNPIDFGTVKMGDSASLDVQVTNANPARSIVVTAIRTEGDTELSVSPTAPPRTLAPAASLTVRASFHPAAAGDFAATLVVEDDFEAPRLATMIGSANATGTAPTWPPAEPRPIERVSVSSREVQGDRGADELAAVSVSRDGRFVAYASSSTNLVPDDLNGQTDIFVRDRLKGTTERVSLTDGGGDANGDSRKPAISGDGRYVAFESDATNLVPGGDTNGAEDVFIRDRQAGRTFLVSVSSSGERGNFRSVQPSISNDGRVVAFASTSTNLVPDDTNNSGGTFAPDIFVHDLDAGTTERVSVTSDGGQGEWSGAGSMPAAAARPRSAQAGGSWSSARRSTTSSPGTRTARTTCSSTTGSGTRRRA